MPVVAMIFGALLIGEGTYFYLTSDAAKKITALIPAFVGLPLFLCGLIALKEKFLKHAMHVAAMLGLLGAIGAGMRFFPALFKNEGPMSRPMQAQLIMILLCVGFVALCVNSFIQVRKRREKSEQNQEVA